MREPLPVDSDELTLRELDPRTRQLVEQVRATRRPLRITEGGADTAVLVEADAYRKQQQRLAVMEHLARGRRALDDGHGIPQEQVEVLLEEWLAGGA